MKLLPYILALLFFQSCSQRQRSNAPSNDIVEIDTNFLKQAEWKPLNKYVSFHAVKPGYISNDTPVLFKLVPIALYSYGEKTYTIDADSSIDLNLEKLRTFLLSDTFPNRKEADYIFKINSEIAYLQNPRLLETIFVRAYSNDKKKIDLLIEDLKKEAFIKSVIVNSDSLINVKIDSDHANLKEIGGILQELKDKDNVEDAFFTDLFTGFNKQDVFYRMTSK